MRDVRAAARHHVHVAAQGAAEFGLASGRHHLKLLDGIDAVGDPAQRGGVIVGRQTVDDDVVGEVALSGHRQADPGNGRSLRKELGAGDVGRRNPWHQERKVEDVPAVERQRANLGRRDRCGDLAARGFEYRTVD